MSQNFSLGDMLHRLKTLKDKIHSYDFFSVLNHLKKLKNRTSDTLPHTSSDTNKTSSSASFKSELSEFSKSMFSAMLLALTIRTLLLQPFNIPSESMLPNLLVGDYLFVSKYTYGYSKYSLPFAPNLFNGRLFASQPKRGDVVVFRVVDDSNKDYIKRIIGLPGDKIRFVNGSILVNDIPALIGKIGTFGTDTINPETIGADILTEKLGKKTYEILDVFKTPYDNTGDYIVPKGHYFFAGDNRDNSQDSRFLSGPVGFVPEDRLIGRAEFIFFSIKDTSILEFWNWPKNIRFDRIFKKIN